MRTVGLLTVIATLAAAAVTLTVTGTGESGAVKAGTRLGPGAGTTTTRPTTAPATAPTDPPTTPAAAPPTTPISVPATTVAATPATSAKPAPSTPPAPTPSALPAAAAGGGSLRGKVVAIDPGHNGQNWAHTAEINQLVPAGGFTKACDTTGTQTDAGYTESAFNLDVALRLAADLRQLGASVVLTRTTDNGWGPCIDQRAAVGNQAHASAAISIHADGGPADGRGFEVIQPALIAGYTAPIVNPSHLLALDLIGHFGPGTGMPTSTYLGVGGLDTRSDLGGLNLSTVPKVLVECGNMRNATDAALLGDPGFRQKAADALSAGIGAFLGGLPA